MQTWWILLNCVRENCQNLGDGRKTMKLECGNIQYLPVYLLFLLQTLFVNINEKISLHIFDVAEELVIHKIQRIALSLQTRQLRLILFFQLIRG